MEPKTVRGPCATRLNDWMDSHLKISQKKLVSVAPPPPRSPTSGPCIIFEISQNRFYEFPGRPPPRTPQQQLHHHTNTHPHSRTPQTLKSRVGLLVFSAQPANYQAAIRPRPHALSSSQRIACELFTPSQSWLTQRDLRISMLVSSTRVATSLSQPNCASRLRNWRSAGRQSGQNSG